MIFAMDTAVDSTPLNPNNPATIAIIKNNTTHPNMIILLLRFTAIIECIQCSLTTYTLYYHVRVIKTPLKNHNSSLYLLGKYLSILNDED